MRIYSVKFAVILLWTLLAIPAVVQASHFRGGSIQWSIPDPISAPYTVRFKVQQAWRTTGLDCEEISFGDNVTSVDGCASRRTTTTATDELGLGYTLIEYDTTHTYRSSPASYTVFFSSCCRISQLSNGADGDFRVQAIVNVGLGKRGGPIAALSNITTLNVGASRIIDFSIIDPDGDPVSCRAGTASEVGFASPIPVAQGKSPVVTSLRGKCTITWDLTAAITGRAYTLAVIAESSRNGKVSALNTDVIILFANSAAYGVCDASPVGSIERTDMLAGWVNSGVTVARTTTHFNVICRNTRFGTIRIPSRSVPTARQGCAMVQTDCTSVPEKPARFCHAGMTAAELSQIETAADADLNTLLTTPKFKQLIDFICEAK
jgi:hypothetical protein